jgi:hypothetical protein
MIFTNGTHANSTASSGIRTSSNSAMREGIAKAETGHVYNSMGLKGDEVVEVEDYEERKGRLTKARKGRCGKKAVKHRKAARKGEWKARMKL